MKLSFTKKTKKFIWSPIHPHRDWKIIIIAFFLLTIGVVLWSCYIFFFYQSDVIPTQSTTVNNTNTLRVRSIEKAFKARPMVDPAI